MSPFSSTNPPVSTCLTNATDPLGSSLSYPAFYPSAYANAYQGLANLCSGPPLGSNLLTNFNGLAANLPPQQSTTPAGPTQRAKAVDEPPSRPMNGYAPNPSTQISPTNGAAPTSTSSSYMNTLTPNASAVEASAYAAPYPSLYAFPTASNTEMPYGWSTGLPAGLQPPMAGQYAAMSNPIGMQNYANGLLPTNEEISPGYPALTAETLAKYDGQVQDPTLLSYAASAAGGTSWPPAYPYVSPDDKPPVHDNSVPQLPPYIPDRSFYPPPLQGLNPMENSFHSANGLTLSADLYGSQLNAGLNGMPANSAAPIAADRVPNGNSAAARYPSPSGPPLPPASTYNPAALLNGGGPLSAGSNVPVVSKARSRRSRSSVKDCDNDDTLSNEDKEQERRCANNTRERIRVKDINQAFSSLGKLCTQHNPTINERSLTKLTILHSAVDLITQLENQVKQRNLNPRAACMRRRSDQAQH